LKASSEAKFSFRIKSRTADNVGKSSAEQSSPKAKLSIHGQWKEVEGVREVQWKTF